MYEPWWVPTLDIYQCMYFPSYVNFSCLSAFERHLYLRTHESLKTPLQTSRCFYWFAIRGISMLSASSVLISANVITLVSCLPLSLCAQVAIVLLFAVWLSSNQLWCQWPTCHRRYDFKRSIVMETIFFTIKLHIAALSWTLLEAPHSCVAVFYVSIDYCLQESAIMWA